MKEKDISLNVVERLLKKIRFFRFYSETHLAVAS